MERDRKVGNWWVVIDPDSWVSTTNGAFDIKAFKKRGGAALLNETH